MREPLKAPSLVPGSRVAMVSPASPAEPERLDRGRRELARLGYRVDDFQQPAAPGYFAGSADDRLTQLLSALQERDVRGVFCTRGGYGSNYLLDGLSPALLAAPKVLVGYSDITTLQIFLWQTLGWVTFYGPMVAAGFDTGADAAGGYDANSFTRAVTETRTEWSVGLCGEAVVPGEAEGVILGGCMTLVEATLGTPWELDTKGAILVLEDRAMKPYQVDRVLRHLVHAGKLSGVRGMLLGEFPECEPTVAASPSVLDVCKRILGPLRIPVAWGAPLGHTKRPMLTLPLGVRVRLRARGAGRLDILEPAVLL